LRAPLQWNAWKLPLRLGTVTMLATMAMIAGAAHVFFELSFAQALLLGAVLAPTDPVLASDVHMPASGDHEPARFALAGEGGINTGLGVPAVAFGRGLIGLSDVPPPGLAWAGIELVWGVAGGAALGWCAGTLLVRGIARLDWGRQPDFFEDLLVILGAGMAYAAALALHANAFFTVFAFGVALCHRGRLRRAATLRPPDTRYVALAQNLERVVSAIVVLLVGALVTVTEVRPEMFLFALLLLAVVRPVAVRLGLGQLPVPPDERRLLAWFGVRGAASLYLLALALDQGVGAPLARELAAITLVALATSILLHGLSATPLVSGPVGNRRA